jgi:hypothetical protein
MPRLCWTTLLIRPTRAKHPATWASAVLLCSRLAVAEEPSQPQSLAQGLFDDARELMEHSLFAEACPKLATSFRLDPATGTLLNLAVCYEQQGKTASAYYAFVNARARAVQEGNAQRQLLAEQRITALEPTLSRVAITQPEPVLGLWIAIDGVRTDAVHLGAAFPLDPGRHVLEYGAPNRVPISLTIEVTAPGEKLLIQLQPLQTAPIKKPAVTIGPPPPVGPTESNDTAWAAVGISYGLALSGAVATAYFGFRAKSEWDDRNRICASGCTEDAKLAGQRANQFAWMANASGGVALLSAGLGTYWLLNSRSSHSPPKSVNWTPSLHRQGATVAAEFAF